MGRQLGPAVVADAERGGFLIVRLENGVTVPAQKARLQLTTRRSTAPTSPDVPAARASRAVWRRRMIGRKVFQPWTVVGGAGPYICRRLIQRLRCPASTVRRDRRSTLANEANQREQSQIPGEQDSLEHGCFLSDRIARQIRAEFRPWKPSRHREFESTPLRQSVSIRQIFCVAASKSHANRPNSCISRHQR